MYQTAILRVDYDEGVKGSYRKIEITICRPRGDGGRDCQVEYTFDTGDIVVDYHDAVAFMNGLENTVTMASSSLDHFIMDHDGEFEFVDPGETEPGA